MLLQEDLQPANFKHMGVHHDSPQFSTHVHHRLRKYFPRLPLPCPLSDNLLHLSSGLFYADLSLVLRLCQQKSTIRHPFLHQNIHLDNAGSRLDLHWDQSHFRN